MLQHSVVSSIDYNLKANGKVVAQVWKVKGGFQVRRIAGNLAEDKTIRNMKLTKIFVAGLLPPEALKAPEKPARITVKDAFRKCGMSHSRLYVELRELKRVWPEIRPQDRGAYMVRKHMEACAKWPGLGFDFARRWLEENPTVGQFDHAEELRRLEKLYGTEEAA